MVKRSLKASEEGIIKAKKAFELRQWSQEYLAAEVGLSTRNSVWKFFSGRPIERYIFIDICFKLDLDWEDIADLPNFSDSKKGLKKYSDNVTNKDNLSKEDDAKLEQFRTQLRGQIQAQCGSIQTWFNINQYLPIESVYIDLKALTSISNQRWLDLSEFTNISLQSRNSTLSPLEEKTVDVIDIANKHQRLILMGKPGSGKSTFLQHLALLCLENKFKNDCLPIFISLKILALQRTQTSNFSLINYIKQTWAVSGISDQEIDFLAMQGKILILLDGLEEVSRENNQLILVAIQQFANLYYQCHIIITCRLGTPINILQGFHYVELADLDEQQVENYAQKWFIANNQSLESENKLKYAQFLELLKRPKNELVRELTKTPILLSLLCSIFQEKAKFPAKLSKLYQEALEIILPQSKNLLSTSFDFDISYLSLPNQIKVLSQIASIGFEQENYFYEKQEIINIIIQSWQNITIQNINHDPESLLINAENFLHTLETQHGLLVERAKGIYSFSHLTFQEYLTARNFSHRINILKQEDYLKKLAIKIHDSSWQSVIFLTLEMLSDPTLLINEITKSLNDIIEKHNKIKTFFNSLQEKYKLLDVSAKPEAIIAFYWGLLQIKDLNLAIALDVQLGSDLPQDLALDLALIRALNLAISLSKNATLEDILELGFALDLEQGFPILKEFQIKLNNLKNQLLNEAEDSKKLLNWWKVNANNWIKQFRNLVIEYRFIGKDWQFNQQELKILNDYYNNYLFLVNCLFHIAYDKFQLIFPGYYADKN